MKSFLVSATTAAVLSVLSSGAFAVVNLDDGTNAKKYAKELVTAGTTALTGSAVDVSSTLGFGVSAGQSRFIRYDLTNAKFKKQVVFGDLSSVTGFDSVVVSQGGAPGDTSVIFQITGKAVTGNAQSDVVTFKSGSPVGQGLIIQSAGAAVQMAYSLYETGAAAAAGGAAGRLNSNNAPQTVAALTTGVAFSTAPSTTTVSVAATPAYTRFLVNGGGTSVTAAKIGTVTIDADTTVLDPDTGAPITYAQLVANNTKLVLKGDFSGSVSPSTGGSGIFMAAATDCTVGGGLAPNPTVVTNTANFVVNATPVVGRALCFTLPTPNTTAIAAQTFTVEADIVPAGTSTTADQPPIPAGTFERDGTVLKAAFAETTGVAGVSRAVSMSNTSNLDAPYTVSCLVNSTATVNGNAGTLKKNSSARLALTGTNGLGCPADGTLRGVVLTFQSVKGNVIGSLVSQSLSTGQASYDAMTGNQ